MTKQGYHMVSEPRRRPTKDEYMVLAEFGTATISSALREVCGILRHYIQGPRCVVPGQRLIGVAATLAFLPKRSDVEEGMEEEESEKDSPLWAAVIGAQEDDVLVVDCRGNMQTGCLGGMLMTALRTNGAAGLVVDGCVRDLPEAIDLSPFPIFVLGGTPHNAGHFEMYPMSYMEPIGVGGSLVLPGDIIIGDDDGVVVCPPHVITEVAEYCHSRETREKFERGKLVETGNILKYYPLNHEGELEYLVWLKQTGTRDPTFETKMAANGTAKL